MLGRVIGEHWLPLVRDVLALGFRAEDMFTVLSVAEMVAIVVGAPPNSSVRCALDGGWSKEAHLLANLQEGYAGVGELREPYRRPGVEGRAGGAEVGNSAMFGGKAESMSWDEAVERDKARYAAAEEAARRGIKPVNTRVRTL